MENKNHTQAIINRFTVQAFAIKGFSVAFIGLISSTLDKYQSISLTIIAVITIVVFWFLDTYYLRMGRIYRDLEEIYDQKLGLDYKKYNIKKGYKKVAFSITMWPLYLIQIAYVVVLALNVFEVIS